MGAARSKHTLRKDHRKQSGESGPRFVRDERGTTYYWHSDLEAWAAQQRAKLSPHNPPPAPFFDGRAAQAIRQAKQKRLQAEVVESSDSSKTSRKISRISRLPQVAQGDGSRPGSNEGRS